MKMTNEYTDFNPTYNTNFTTSHLPYLQRTSLYDYIATPSITLNRLCVALPHPPSYPKFPMNDEERKAINKIRRPKERHQHLKRAIGLIDWKKVCHPIFMTLTWAPKLHNGKRTMQEAVKYFLGEIHRWIPNLKHIWVRELHKSGKPHYHCILWTTDTQGIDITKQHTRRRIRAEWHKNFYRPNDRALIYTCQTKVIKNINNVKTYIAKYLSKGNNATNTNTKKNARSWGKSNNIPQIEVIKRELPVPIALKMFKDLQQLNLITIKNTRILTLPNGRPMAFIGYFQPKDRDTIIKYQEMMIRQAEKYSARNLKTIINPHLIKTVDDYHKQLHNYLDNPSNSIQGKEIQV